MIKVMYNFYTDSIQPAVSQLRANKNWCISWMHCGQTSDSWKTLFTTRRRIEEEPSSLFTYFISPIYFFYGEHYFWRHHSKTVEKKNWRRPTFKKTTKNKKFQLCLIQWSRVWFSGWTLISDSFWILCSFIELEILCVYQNDILNRVF